MRGHPLYSCFPRVHRLGSYPKRFPFVPPYQIRYSKLVVYPPTPPHPHLNENSPQKSSTITLIWFAESRTWGRAGFLWLRFPHRLPTKYHCLNPLFSFGTSKPLLWRSLENYLKGRMGGSNVSVKDTHTGLHWDLLHTGWWPGQVTLNFQGSSSHVCKMGMAMAPTLCTSSISYDDDEGLSPFSSSDPIRINFFQFPKPLSFLSLGLFLSWYESSRMLSLLLGQPLP